MISEKKALSFNGYFASVILLLVSSGCVVLWLANTAPFNVFELAKFVLLVVVLACWAGFFYGATKSS